MESIYRFFATYEGLIYIFLALGGMFAARWLWKAWNEWRNSVFGLEREFAFRRMSQAVIISILLLFLFLGELFLVSFLVPSLPATDLLATPTIDILNKTEGVMAGNSTLMMNLDTPVAGFASNSEGGCVPGEIDLTVPEAGQEVRGAITLVGTVDVQNFGFYKYEVSPQASDTWVTISAGRDIIRDGDVGLWDASALTPGDYRLRLEVTDNQGQAYPPCVVPVRVLAP